MIQKRNLVPETPPLHVENWPWPVKIFTLGRFEIVRDGKPIHFTGKVQKKPLEMLRVLISFGSKDVGEERIIDALWPEADGDVAHISLRTTVHRLRQLIGNDGALQFSEGRISLDPRYCWVDAWSFLRIAGEAEDLWKRGHCGKDTDADNDHIRDAIAVSEKAVNLYKGDFLSGDSKYPWAFPIRERLKSKFIRLIGRLGRCHEHSEQWDKAIECYQRAIEEDSLQEEFYQKLMICYQRCGKRAAALTTYKRCRDELSSALGIEPSRETLRVYEAVLNEGR